MREQTEERTTHFSRRQFLCAAGAAAATAAHVRAADEPGGGRPAAFRFVHLADLHIQPELGAAQGVRKCLDAVHALTPRPEFILTGGDLVMDLLAVDSARAKVQFDLLEKVTRDCEIPIRHCIGNHDVFGWGPNAKIGRDHADYGKKLVRDRVGLARTTYSFDHKGWHFCVVDDIQPKKPAGYEGGFSKADLAWLDQDLAAAGDRPKVVCTHVPIVSVVPFRGADATDKENIAVSKGMICRNPGPILGVLNKRRVAFTLGGHLHQNETLRYQRTTHIGQGAVCGNWWKGPYVGNPEGFGVLDVRADGTFAHRYHTYGWKART